MRVNQLKFFRMRSGVLTWIGLFSVVSLLAQNKAPKVWASVSFSKRSVVVGEPLVATVTVYTSTWFTDPPDFGEIQSPNSMTIRLQQRTGSKMARIDGQNYPAIEQKYLIYPLQTGENVFPPLKVILTSPDEGDYKGTKRTVRSPERTFQVAGLPTDIARGKWLVADNISLTESWDRPLDGLKAGDVLERRITIRVIGPPAALIAPLPVPEIEFGTVYPRPARLTNTQNKASLTGIRTETMAFLLEKPGTFTIPEVKVGIYQPRSRKTLEKNIPAKEINIDENPNLEFILSMQDSLRGLLAESEAEEIEPEPFEWMGLNWWQLLLVILFGLGTLVIFYRLIRWLLEMLKKNKALKAESEATYFKSFLHSIKSNDKTLIKKHLMQWYDRFRSGRYGPAFDEFTHKAEVDQLSEDAAILDQLLFDKENPSGNWSGEKFADELKQARKKNQEEEVEKSARLPPVNP